MRTLSLCVVAASAFMLVVACGSKNQQQPGTTPTATAYPGGYPPGTYPPGAATYPGQPGAPGAAPGYAAPGQPGAPGAPVGPAPAGTGTMATPGALALPCTNDLACGTNHCNTQYGKCAFPCQTAADCITPNQCGPLGFCIPNMGGH